MGSAIVLQRELNSELYYNNSASLSPCCSVSMGVQNAHCCDVEIRKMSRAEREGK
jgi:hypothetical protein